MKIRKIYAFTVALGAFLFFQSNSGGPGAQFSRQVSGAPGSQGNLGTCGNSGCHSSGAFDPSLSLQLLDGTDPVDGYLPGNTYTLRIVNTPGSGSPARFGFQAVALDGTDSQAGAWGNVGTGRQTVTLGGRSYVEHSAPSTSGTFEVEWVAPVFGTGNVTFYSAGNAVNGNGNSSGDGTAAATLTVEENAVSSTAELARQQVSLTVMPNPVGDRLNLQVTSRSAGNFYLRIINVSGGVVHQTPLNLNAGLNRTELDVAGLPAGLYVLQLSGEQQVAAAQMLKR